MRKKRRLLFLAVNLLAILFAAGSVFLPYWRGLRPSDVPLSELLPFDFSNALSFSPSVVIMLFIGLAIILLGGLLALRSVVLIGAIINGLVVALWFLTFDIGWRPNQFGYGLYLLFLSIFLNILAILIPRRRKERKS
jgi:hypothetical protein